MDTFRPNRYFQYYMYWITERQNIFWQRLHGERPPYTSDPIMQHFKFTNVYRVLDRTTQYLLRDVIYLDKHYNRADMFWRILLFKHFNLPSTWQYLCKNVGDITLATDLEDIIDCLTEYHERGNPLYSNAYMLTASFMKNERIKTHWGIPPNTRNKHDAYLHIFRHEIIKKGLHRQILNAQTFRDAFDLIRQVPTVGDFLAYQYVQDWNYSQIIDFSNNTFCAAGYGTIRGIERTFDIVGKPDYDAIVRWVYSNFNTLLAHYDFKDQFKPIPGWQPQVPDLSNCFCEVDKYLRESRDITPTDKVIHGKRMKNTFNPNNTPIEYIFPPKWNVEPLYNV